MDDNDDDVDDDDDNDNDVDDDAPASGAREKSAANGPADDALTASTRLYRDARLPRTSPAIRILTAFGSDIASGLSGARELWRRTRGNRHLQEFTEGWIGGFPKLLPNTK